MKKKLLITGLLFVILFNIYSNEINTYQFNRSDLKHFNELEIQKNQISSFDQFKSWINQIIRLFLINNKNTYLYQYLSEIEKKEKNDSFKSYSNFIISDLYWNQENIDISLYYMLKIDKKFYHLQFNNNPIGYLIAKRIASTQAPFNIKKSMYQILFNQYQEIIDIPYTLYEMAELYKKNYKMKEAMTIYKKIIDLKPINEIAEDVSLTQIKQDYDYYNLKKTWIYQDLESLINKIKKAIKSRNTRLLYPLISKSHFEIKTAQKNSIRNWSLYELKIYNKWNSRIQFENDLEEFSNENEAYLKTSNWNFPQLKTWYFYFKKINYPYDPEIHNGWEWSGIYFSVPFLSN